MKLVDPIKLLQNKYSETAAEPTQNEVPFEVPLTPPLGATLHRMTIASTYRTPIPVMFDAATRTTYPLTNEE
jgi:hypothetical protein